MHFIDKLEMPKDSSGANKKGKSPAVFTRSGDFPKTNLYIMITVR